MNIVRTPEDPDTRYQVALADTQEAKAKMWRSLASLANLAFIAAFIALAALAVAGALEMTPWM